MRSRAAYCSCAVRPSSDALAYGHASSGAAACCSCSFHGDNSSHHSQQDPRSVGRACCYRPSIVVVPRWGVGHSWRAAPPSTSARHPSSDAARPASGSSNWLLWESGTSDIVGRRRPDGLDYTGTYRVPFVGVLDQCLKSFRNTIRIPTTRYL